MTELPPRLETENRVELASGTGEEVQISIVRRGILKTESKTYKSARTAFEAMASYDSPRKSFEKLCESLRCRLDRVGLPSDRQKIWVEVAEGQWEPYDKELHPISILYGAHQQLWISRLYALTEPLSQERCVGDYLNALTRLLDKPSAEPLLWHVAECINAAIISKLAGPINLYATAGISARRCRAKGPKTNRNKAAQRKEITERLVLKLWAISPIYKGSALISATMIEGELNQELQAKKLHPRGRVTLARKTICDYIRAVIGAQKF